MRFNYHLITSILKSPPNTGLGQFKYFTDAVMSRSETEFIHFLRGNVRVLERKVAKFAI